jgi:hypothetical protein
METNLLCWYVFVMLVCICYKLWSMFFQGMLTVIR